MSLLQIWFTFVVYIHIVSDKIYDLILHLSIFDLIGFEDLYYYIHLIVFIQSF